MFRKPEESSILKLLHKNQQDEIKDELEEDEPEEIFQPLRRALPSTVGLSDYLYAPEVIFFNAMAIYHANKDECKNKEKYVDIDVDKYLAEEPQTYLDFSEDESDLDDFQKLYHFVIQEIEKLAQENTLAAAIIKQISMIEEDKRLEYFYNDELREYYMSEFQDAYYMFLRTEASLLNRMQKIVIYKMREITYQRLGPNFDIDNYIKVNFIPRGLDKTTVNHLLKIATKYAKEEIKEQDSKKRAAMLNIVCPDTHYARNRFASLSEMKFFSRDYLETEKAPILKSLNSPFFASKPSPSQFKKIGVIVKSKIK